MKRVSLNYSIASLIMIIGLVAVLAGVAVYFVLRVNSANTPTSPMAGDDRKIILPNRRGHHAPIRDKMVTKLMIYTEKTSTMLKDSNPNFYIVNHESFREQESALLRMQNSSGACIHTN